jgi:hypothetical protein
MDASFSTDADAPAMGKFLIRQDRAHLDDTALDGKQSGARR